MKNVPRFILPVSVVLIVLLLSWMDKAYDRNNPSAGLYAVAMAILLCGAMLSCAVYYKPKD
jgi:hypothetical protein